MYVAIPTYKRSHVIVKKTLNTLLKGGVSPSSIYIFVANSQERDTYAEAVPSTMYKSMIIGKLGITAQRNFIRNYFDVDSLVVSIDDDIEGLYKLSKDKLVSIQNVDEFFKSAFKKMELSKAYIWGIYPVRNPFFMKPGTTTKLSFILGALHGYKVRHTPKLTLNPKAEGKEDYEQSILYYLLDGSVLRFNNVTVKTKFLDKGGLGEDRFERNKLSANYLQTKYPSLVTIFHRKKNNMTEVRFTRKLSSKIG